MKITSVLPLAAVIAALTYVVTLPMFLDRNVTPWQRQANEAAQHDAFTVALGSDGCYWRTYLDHGSRRHTTREIEVLPDNTQFCPYREKK